MNRKRLIGFLLILVVIAFWIKNETDKKEILKNGIITYGKLTAIQETGWYSRASTNYIYYIDNHKYYELSGNTPPDSLEGKIKIGNFYKVIYLPEKPNRSIMLFDKEVKDTFQLNKIMNLRKR